MGQKIGLQPATPSQVKFLPTLASHVEEMVGEKFFSTAQDLQGIMFDEMDPKDLKKLKAAAKTIMRTGYEALHQFERSFLLANIGAGKEMYEGFVWAFKFFDELISAADPEDEKK